eukprot:TRINITY_DN3921_c2_g1_i1.p2 TRINITY_DN3921_c2_g1~~TRINITY_DN3921_c2_g1_i1.p2  ORF type:complete len:236 (+),score=26.08 TRINITY_DN3921_c2_g1_i1:133-840(+)
MLRKLCKINLGSNCRGFKILSGNIILQQSSNQQNAETDYQSVKQSLMEKALESVPQQGWSQTSLQEAARQLGYSPAIAGGIEDAELVWHFMSGCNEKLRNKFESLLQELGNSSVKEKVKRGLIERLMMNGPYINTLPQAYSIVCAPHRLQKTMQIQHQMIDDIWHFAGDKSTDLRWYGKRMTLAGIYAATELYMLTDFSPDFEDTKKALDRRLEEIQELASMFRGRQEAQPNESK